MAQAKVGLEEPQIAETADELVRLNFNGVWGRPLGTETNPLSEEDEEAVIDELDAVDIEEALPSISRYRIKKFIEMEIDNRAAFFSKFGCLVASAIPPIEIPENLLKELSEELLLKKMEREMDDNWKFVSDSEDESP